MTIADATKYIKKHLDDAGISESNNETRIILTELAGFDRTALLSHPDIIIDDEVWKKIEDCVNRRVKREPLQYIIGSWNFMGLQFDVKPNVLIPRPDTEILVETALENLHDGMRILDLCTGTGCIIISLLHYSNDCTGTAVDISTDALKLARQNAYKILVGKDSLDNKSEECIEIIGSDLYEEVSGTYDIIVSNPPYINSSVIDTLETEVKDFEPHLALDGGEDGLDLIRRIIDGSDKYLNRGGHLIMEIGYDQGDRVCKLMEEAGFIDVLCVKDYAGLDRVVRGTKSVLR